MGPNGPVELNLQQMILVNSTLKSHEFTFERLDIKISPEKSIWIRDTSSRLGICILTNKSTLRTTYTVEWPNLADEGEFIELQHITFEGAVAHFEFSLRMFADIAKAVHEVL